MVTPPKGFGVRHIQVIFWFFQNLIAYSMRFNLSVAIVAMTKQTSTNSNIPYYNWDNKNVVLSSFFWGYIVFQIPAGDLGRIFGTKKILLICMLTNAVLVVLTPVTAQYLGAEGMMSARVVQGLAQGFFFPLLSNNNGKWAPMEERARIGSITFSGSTLGLVITYTLTGFLCKSSMGWPMSFYFFGSLGFVWTILYYCYGSDDPATHKTISHEEKIYLQASLGTTHLTKYKTPWKSILSSIPLWAIIITSLGQGWGASTVISEMPTYFDKVLKFNISSNGVLSALPYIGSFFTTYLVGFTSDFLINNNYLSVTNARKLFNTIGSCGAGIILFIFGFLPEDTNRYVAVAFLVVSMSLHAATAAGYNINHIDLSPNFAGVLMGLVNEAGELLSIVTPLAVQVLVTDETDRNQWKIIISIGTGMFIMASIIFGIFATADRQSWNEVNTDEENKNLPILA